MEILPNDVILLIYPELSSYSSVAALSSTCRRFRGVFESNKTRILKRVYARNFAVNHPLAHQDAFRLARFMVTTELPPANGRLNVRIPVSQLTIPEIRKLEENQKIIKFLEEKFLESRRASHNKALHEELNEHEVDKFCQSASRFWLFCLVFAEDPRNRVGQKSFVESWCYHSAADLQSLRELILFQWQLLRDAIPESEEMEVQDMARKMGMRCFSKAPPDHTSDRQCFPQFPPPPNTAQWIEFILSRGPEVIVDIVKQKSLLRRMYYISQSSFANRLDAAQFDYICGGTVAAVMRERQDQMQLSANIRGILDK